MKTFRKAISLLLAGAMSLSLLAGCGASSQEGTAAASTTETAADATGGEPRKIGVMFNSMSSKELQQKEYLENYVGPAFNVEFMFSESLKDNGAAVTFIEQARAAGCEGLMNFYSDGIEQATVTANNAGMYIINENNYIPDTTAGMSYNLGSIGTSVEAAADIFGELLQQILADGKEHNVVIVSGGAAQGNRQHKEMTQAILQIMQENYGLTYDTDIETLATSNTQTIIDTGSIKIAIYPGYAGTDTYVTGFSNLLQSGEYDTVLSTYTVYSQLVQPISEVENAFGLDINLVSVASIDESAQNSFEQGALDSAMLTPACLTAGGMFVLLYNAMEGNATAVQQNGTSSQYHINKWICKDAEQYKTVEQLDIAPETYAITVDDIQSLLVSANPDVNYDTVDSFFSSLTADAVAEKSGL